MARPASVAPKRTPYLWKISADGSNRCYRHPSHRDFGIERGNTLVSESGELNDTVEAMLARVEGVVAKVLRDVVPNRLPLDRDQVDALNMFFSTMQVRAPSRESATTNHHRESSKTKPIHRLPCSVITQPLRSLIEKRGEGDAGDRR